MSQQLNTEKIEDFVIELLIREHGFKREKLKLDIPLASKLGVDGDDAWELLQVIGQRFGVNLEDVFDNHFWPEAGLFKSDSIVPITIAKLAQIIILKLHLANETLDDD